MGYSLTGSRLEALQSFCRSHHIRQLSVFGSILHGDAHADSDLDLLVEFEPGYSVGLIRMAGIQLELSALLGRPVDLRTAQELSRYIRDEVLAEARHLLG